MWAEDPRMRSCSSPCRPVISAIAMMSAITPTVTPRVETSEITEMKTCRRLANKYRSASCSSKGIRLRLVALRAHEREQDHVANRRRVGEQHDESIDADPLTAGRRHAVLERAHVVFVHDVRLL